ncbi:hypothetical protein AK812_SmicGene13857 [Symbiodinium microadriaticum]|uniref:Uncharacterized protein n=1 Tax=Symbiodinium microadriaticum TaxID=2951 RepID=A0A1Q9E715_SYMMI|nr:hypothetical protein AK812_SmicGene13857 [Symbiodinium microadriaticum]
MSCKRHDSELLLAGQATRQEGWVAAMKNDVARTRKPQKPKAGRGKQTARPDPLQETEGGSDASSVEEAEADSSEERDQQTGSASARPSREVGATSEEAPRASLTGTSRASYRRLAAFGLPTKLPPDVVGGIRGMLSCDWGNIAWSSLAHLHSRQVGRRNHIPLDLTAMSTKQLWEVYQARGLWELGLLHAVMEAAEAELEYLLEQDIQVVVRGVRGFPSMPESVQFRQVSMLELLRSREHLRLAARMKRCNLLLSGYWAFFTLALWTACAFELSFKAGLGLYMEQVIRAGRQVEKVLVAGELYRKTSASSQHAEVIVYTEPTNYLDQPALAALAAGLKVKLICTNRVEADVPGTKLSEDIQSSSLRPWSVRYSKMMGYVRNESHWPEEVAKWMRKTDMTVLFYPDLRLF